MPVKLIYLHIYSTVYATSKLACKLRIMAHDPMRRRPLFKWPLFNGKRKRIIRKGVIVSYHQLEKRFGITAVQMGFITTIQLHEAMTVQLNENLYGLEHRLIGRILLERAYITSAQIREVLRQMGMPARFCPCGHSADTDPQIAERSKN